MLFRYRAPLFARSSRVALSCLLAYPSIDVTGYRISYRQDQILVGTACGRRRISFESFTDKIKSWSVLLVDVVIFRLTGKDSFAETLLYRPVDLLSSSYFGVQEVLILISGTVKPA